MLERSRSGLRAAAARRFRLLLWIGLGLGAAYVLAPQVPALVISLQSLPPMQPAWVVAGVGLVAFRYAMAAVSLQVVVTKHLPFTPTVFVQLASSFVGRLTPEGVGSLILNQRYLERSGIERASALAAITLKLLVGGLVRLLIAFVVLAQLGIASSALQWNLTAVAALVAAGVGGGVAVILVSRAVRARRPEAWARVVGAGADLRLVLTDPRRAALLIATTGALTLAYGFALAASLAAFGVDLPLVTVLGVYLGGTALAALSPTPGNIGAIEVVLAAGLTTVGVPPPMALAAVILYRALTFWLPVLPGFLAFRYLQKRHLL